MTLPDPSSQRSGTQKAPGLTAWLVGLLWLPLASAGMEHGPGAPTTPERGSPEIRLTTTALLAQAQSVPDPAIPPEVQGWFDGAKAAAARGDAAEALRLQKQVVAWLQAHPGAPAVFRARALINLGLYTSGVGLRQEALAPTEEAVKILRQVEGSQPEARRILAIALTNLGADYSELGRYQEVLALTQGAVTIRRELARTNPAFLPDLGHSLGNLGATFIHLRRHQEAVAPTEEAVKIYRELAETNPVFLPDLAGFLNNLGEVYRELGHRQEALATTEEALKIRRELAKTNSEFLPAVANSLNNLGNLMSELGRRQEALGPTEEAVRIYRQLAKINPLILSELAVSLSNLGIRYSELGRRQEALVPTEEAVRVYRKLAKTNPSFLPNLALSLNNLGKFLSELGRHQEALTTTEAALKIRSELAKTNRAFLPDLAMSLQSLGIRYSNLGSRQQALAPTEEAVKIYRAVAKTNPAFQNDLAGSLTNLGKVLSELGRRQEALTPTEEAVNLYRKQAQSNPAFRNELANSLNNLGVVYSDLGRHQNSLAPTKEAVTIRRDLATTNPAFLPDLASSLNNLGKVLSELDRHQEALAPTAEAVKIYRELAKTNPAFQSDLALSLNNQGKFFSGLGLHQKALAPMEEAVTIRRALAKINPAFQEGLALSASNLAVLQLQQATPSAALPLLRESVSTEVTYLQSQLPLLPEGRRLALVELFGDRWQIPFSQAQQGEAGAALALFTRLNRQGLLQDIQRSQVLLARSGPQRPLFDQLSAVTAQLASTTLTPQQQSDLLERKEQLERELYRQLPQIQPRLVEPSQIAALLPTGGVLVEFQRHRSVDNNAKQYGPPRYLALVLHPDGTIRTIPLGEAAPIDAAVSTAVAASADPKRQAEAPEQLAVVSRLVLAPLLRELAGVKELFVSPDGELNRLPFTALPVAGSKGGGLADGTITADGPTLGDAVALRLLTTGRDLLRLRHPAKAGGVPVLVVNPDFNAAATSADPSERRGRPQRSSGARGLTVWQPLAGTEQEARQLAPLLGDGAVISGPAATTTSVLAQRSPRILHIATHGFFLADQAPARGTGPSRPSHQDPLQRSGLVFAGANQPDANPNDDGYLTAAEATAMDLEGTELVTLSACETGLGGLQSGEGVYGLQRSLAVAGSRATLLSLWKVDDSLTVTFMERFYKRLKAGEGRADALRNTQKDFREDDDSTYHDIRVWGAFQLSGDWRALPGW